MTTEAVPQMIAGGGFALLAWREAKRRAEVPLLPRCFLPTREHAKMRGKSSWHYYRILDFATAATSTAPNLTSRIYL